MTTPTITTASPIKKRRRTLRQRVILRTTTVEPVTIEGQPCIRVSLNGCHGAGKFMLLDAKDWQDVERLFGSVWVLMPMGSVGGAPRFFKVATGRKDAIKKVDPAQAPCGILFLARWLMGVTHRWQHVGHINRDPTDLRRVNLRVRIVGDEGEQPEPATAPEPDDGQGDLFVFAATLPAPICPTCRQALAGSFATH